MNVYGFEVIHNLQNFSCKKFCYEGIMKLFKDTFSFLNRVRPKEKLRPVYRFFSDEKSVSTEKTISNSPEKEHIKTPKLYRIDKDEYDSAIENDFLTGITISAYNEVRSQINRSITKIFDAIFNEFKTELLVYPIK